MYKLVVADLDGTIVHNKEISNKVKQSIKKIQEKGIVFSIATGRHIDGVKKIYKDLGVNGPVVCSNGALVVDPLKNEAISIEVMDNDRVFEIMKVCKKNDSDFLLYTTTEIVGTEGGTKKLLEKLSKDNQIKMTPLPYRELIDKVEDNILKVLIIEYDEEKYNMIHSEVDKIEGIAYTMSQVGFIDCSKKFVNKAYGVAKLAEYYGIGMNDIIAFGDQDNDIEMLQSVGFGVAMNNASPRAKLAADFITGDVRGDGFSFGIEMFVL
jgi:Cof subfamily protein (haloacid dehalogenase superfamily)